MKSGVQLLTDKTKGLLASLALLTKREVLVGIPSDKTQRKDGEGLTNAALGYIHETGAPEANIPARPFLVPGVRKAQDKIAKYMRQAADAALKGDTERVTRAMGAAGQAAASSAQMTIREGIAPPLAQATVTARRRRSKGSKYRRNATTPSQTTPLIDTGQLLRAITWVIREAK